MSTGMTMPAIVIIARSEHAPALRKRLGTDSTIVVFTESEGLRALETIQEWPPRMLVLDSGFVTTSRGAMLVAQVKADPHLKGIDLRVLNQNDDKLPVPLTKRVTDGEAVLLKVSQPLDQCGTRQTARWKVNGDLDILVNGEKGHLVNLSNTGAQILMAAHVRPREVLRLTLLDQSGETRLRARVAWSAAETAGRQVRYRAGIEFIDPDPALIEALCSRYGIGQAQFVS